MHSKLSQLIQRPGTTIFMLGKIRQRTAWNIVISIGYPCEHLWKDNSLIAVFSSPVAQSDLKDASEARRLLVTNACGNLLEFS